MNVRAPAALLVTADAWLSGELGVPAFHLNGSADDARAHLPQHRSFVDAKVPARDIAAVHALLDLGFRPVDVNVTLDRPRAGIEEARAAGVGFAERADAEAVAAIAAASLRTSRFHLDPLVADDVADRLKGSWARGFFAGTRGDWMVVARAGGRAIGFLQLLSRPDALVIDLIAVHADHRGAGLGRAMIGFASEACGDQPLVRVGTQVANVDSLRFYEALGFTIVRTEHVLHRHGSR